MGKIEITGTQVNRNPDPMLFTTNSILLLATLTAQNKLQEKILYSEQNS